MQSVDLVDLLHAAGEVAYEWDLAADRLIWHGVWPTVFGNQKPPHNYQSLVEILYADDDRQILFNTKSACLDHHFRVHEKKAGFLWVHEYAKNKFDDRGQAIMRRGLWRIIDNSTSQLPSVCDQDYDHLTECFKRGVLQRYLAQTIETSKRCGRRCAYLAVDINKMSFINETVGTAAGDDILHAVAAQLKKLIPSNAFLGRMGGDIFGIVLPSQPDGEHRILAERIIGEFQNAPLHDAHQFMHVTVSVGGVSIPDIAHNADEALAFAEQALQQAHQSGRDRFVEHTYETSHTHEDCQTLQIFKQTKRAFTDHKLCLVYQPIVDVRTGEIACYEAFVRLLDDDGRKISAANFVPIVEQMGLSSKLDTMVLDMAIHEMVKRPSLNLAVNISGFTASNGSWCDDTLHMLKDCPAIARRLTIEITETAVLNDLPQVRRLIDGLRGSGVQVSLDDFGAGSTSIRYLRELNISIMKIDKHLLQDLLVNKKQQHLVSTVIDLAQGLGIKTVAEGIETSEIMAWMQQSNIDYMQGFYLGRATPYLPQARFRQINIPVKKSTVHKYSDYQVEAIIEGKFHSGQSQTCPGPD